MPQCPEDFRWVETDWQANTHQLPDSPSKPMDALIEFISTDPLKIINENRLYIAGISMGGFGTWDILMRKPDWFNAAIPICGGADETKAPLIKHIPV